MNKDNVKRLPDQVSLRSTRPAMTIKRAKTTRLAMTNAVGRSMVEMLGVLAIIGVLSAGALAGYSKAMFRHKVNQTIDIFSQVLQRFEELKTKDLGDDFKIETADDIVKYGLLEKCQKVHDWSCKVPLGSLFIESSNTASWIGVTFASPKSCIDFASAHWEEAIPVEWWNTSGISSELVIEGGGDYILYSKVDNTNQNDLANITEACNQECVDGEECHLTIRLGF